MLIDEDPDRPYRLITHELTHIFAFDIIPRAATNFGRVASWIDEGLAEYMTGVWDPSSLGQIRDLVAAGRVPRLSRLAGRGDAQSAGGVANLGHVAFEFIEAEYGRQVLAERPRSSIRHSRGTSASDSARECEGSGSLV